MRLNSAGVVIEAVSVSYIDDSEEAARQRNKGKELLLEDIKKLGRLTRSEVYFGATYESCYNANAAYKYADRAVNTLLVAVLFKIHQPDASVNEWLGIPREVLELVAAELPNLQV